MLELEHEGLREPLRLPIKEVRIQDEEDGSERRYVVCRNEEQARRDKVLRVHLCAGSGKGLVGNRSFKR